MSTMTRVTIVSDDNNKKQKLDTLLNHALERESLLLKTALEKTRANLETFEKRFAKSSEEFYRQYQAGETDDSADTVDWAGEYQIYLSLLEQANTLEELVVCK
jgi:hypothetical protein